MSVCIVSLDSLCRWPVQVSVYCARRIPAHSGCTQCSILLLYFFVADITNTDLFVCDCWTWISIDITHFYEEQCQPSSGSACPKTVNRAPIGGGSGFHTICTIVCHNGRDSSTTRRVCRLEPANTFNHEIKTNCK